MLVILFLFLLIANYLQMMIVGVNYYDEVIAIVAFFFIIRYRKEWKVLESNYKKIMLCISIILLIGCLSTIRYHIQPQFSGVWRDMLAVSKFPICYYAFSLYAQHVNLSIINKKVVPIAKIFILVCFTLGVTTYVIKDHLEGILYHGERYGLPLYDMGFSHNTFLIAAIFMCLAVLIAEGVKKNAFFIFFGVSCVFFTLRSKPMLAIAFLAFAWFIRRRKSIIRFTKTNIVFYSTIIVILTYFLAASQIKTYVGYGESAARGACYFYGVDIAHKFFPLGSGFCTFSSSLSGKYYSPLYYDYNLSQMEGLTPENYNYAADTFWPNIYSQYGWIGLLFYFMMLFFMLRSIHKRFIPLSDQWVAGMFLLLYCFSAAFAEAIYTNSTAVDYALILTLFIGNNNENRPIDSFSFLRRRRKIHC